jgi:hypothetical protein
MNIFISIIINLILLVGVIIVILIGDILALIEWSIYYILTSVWNSLVVN